MAKGAATPASWKPGQSGNPNGRPPRRSLRWHADELYTDDARSESISKVVREARRGKAWAIQLLRDLIGEGQQSPTTQTNVLAILAGADPQLLERLFAVLPMGGSDASGMGSLLQQAGGDVEDGVDALAASDADQ